MGFSIVDPVEGPVCTFNMPQRQLIARAMKELGLALVVRGDDCHDCLYAQVTRASVVHVMETLLTKRESIADVLNADKIRWTSGRRSSDVLGSLAFDALREVAGLPSSVVEVWDNYRLCEHTSIKTARRKRRTKPIE